MSNDVSFYSIHRHGFARVAACTPRVELADPVHNGRETLALIEAGHARHVDLMIFPELGLSAYSIDDLLLQDTLLDAVERTVADLLEATLALRPVCIVGAPVRRGSRVYNCAIVIARGRILGVVPKSFLPNYREFYENRWFAPGAGVAGLDVALAGQDAPFGTDLSSPRPTCRTSRSMSRSARTSGRRRRLPPAARWPARTCCATCRPRTSSSARATTARCCARRSRCAARPPTSMPPPGPGESTTDLAWDGQASIHELGNLLAESERFPADSQMCVADVDLGRLRSDRMRTQTFNNAAVAAGHPERAFAASRFEHQLSFEDVGLERAHRPLPVRARRAGQARSRLLRGVQHPGPRPGQAPAARPARASRDRRLGRARLDPCADRRGQGVRRARPAAHEHPRLHDAGLRDVGRHEGERVGADAGARRQRRGDRHPRHGDAAAARHRPSVRSRREGLRRHVRERAGGLAHRLPVPARQPARRPRARHRRPVGTRARLVHVRCRRPDEPLQRQRLGRQDADPVPRALGRAHRPVRRVDRRRRCSPILDTEISPELVPADDGRRAAEHAAAHRALRAAGLPPVLRHALRDDAVEGGVPRLARMARRRGRRLATGLSRRRQERLRPRDIKRWLGVFLYRFFEISQFKRSAMPNGPKVVSGGNLSPRGDWRAPSDGNARIWLDELGRNVPDEDDDA